MLQEATTFTSQLRRCEKAIRNMAAANAEAGSTIKLVMSAPLPVRWEETAAGAGGATAAPIPIGGPSFSGEVRAKRELGALHLAARIWLARQPFTWRRLSMPPACTNRFPAVLMR